MKVTLRFLLICLLITTVYSKCLAQFTPPGLGQTKLASWYAVGLKQNLNKEKNLNSTTYLGLGLISNPDSYNLFEKKSIYVINEEVSHRFKNHWQYSIALSYRWQQKYNATEPYEKATPEARQEIRYYNRFSYLNSFKKINYSFSYRPELRLFYNPNFSTAEESVQFRSRLRGKMSFHTNSLHTSKLSTTVELLFSTSKTNSWSTFQYKEARFSLYYSTDLPNQHTTLSIGYMNNILGTTNITYAHYLAFDVLINNPF
ncbi:DUF2490 domain-containing protein [Nonlabens sp.]|uniref:DUF2490 domain-containing protein n=1 Tax=Nonlabens sp. TaxID=1888209 RepID=UPI003266272B